MGAVRAGGRGRSRDRRGREECGAPERGHARDLDGERSDHQGRRRDAGGAATGATAGAARALPRAQLALQDAAARRAADRACGYRAAHHAVAVALGVVRVGAGGMTRPPAPGDGGLRGGLYGQIAISGQRLGVARRLVYGLAAPLLAGLMRLWWRSCRVVAVVGAEHLDAVLARHPSFLPVYWHQHHLFCGQYLLAQQATRALRIGFLISPSRDGELGAAIMRRLGGHVIRGSSTRTGALAMKEYFQALMREQVSPVLNPDGPRGPRFVCKPGAVLLAQMSGRPLLPLAYAASRAWLVHWDKFVLPWPLARIAIAVGEPYTVPRGLDAAGLERCQRELEERLHTTFKTARAALKV